MVSSLLITGILTAAEATRSMGRDSGCWRWKEIQFPRIDQKKSSQKKIVYTVCCFKTQLEAKGWLCTMPVLSFTAQHGLVLEDLKFDHLAPRFEGVSPPRGVQANQHCLWSRGTGLEKG